MAFYGNQPSTEDAAKIQAPLLIHCAENDQRINTGWPAHEAALSAATLAWLPTIEFFNKHLRR